MLEALSFIRPKKSQIGSHWSLKPLSSMMSPHRPARMITSSAADELSDWNLPFKNPTSGKPVSYAQTGLKFQSRRKKLILTTKPVLVTQMGIVCVNGRFNMLGCSWTRYTIHHFRFIRFKKATFYLSLTNLIIDIKNSMTWDIRLKRNRISYKKKSVWNGRMSTV